MTALRRHGVTTTGSPGTGRALMLVHGFGCDQAMWQPVADLLPEHHSVLVDLVGFGASDRSLYTPDRYPDLGAHADDIVELCRELELDDVVFVGHSVASMIGVLALQRAPDVFSALVMVGPSPRYIDDDAYRGGFSRDDIDALLESLESNYFGWAQQMAPVIVGRSDTPSFGAQLTESFCAVPPEVAKHFARVTFLSDNRTDLAGMAVRSLILQCAKDVIAPEFVGEWVHANTPHSTLVYLEATGHCPNLTAPHEVADAIKMFRASVIVSGDLSLGIDDAPAAVFVTDDATRLSWVNQTLVRWLGVSDGELVGVALPDLLSVAGRMHFETVVVPPLLLGADVQGLVIEFCRSDGSNMSLLCAATSLAAPDRQRDRLWVGLDISGRRDHELALEISQRRLSRLQRLAAALLQATSSTDIASAVLAELVDGVKADHGVLIGFGPGRESVVLGEQKAPSVAGPSPAALDDVEGLMAVTGERYSTETTGGSVVQYAVLPLLSRARRSGTLAIAVNRMRPFDDAEKLLLRAAGEMTAHALDRAELQRREELANRRSAFISRLVHVLETVNTVGQRAELVADLLVADYADFVTVELLHRDPAVAGLRHRDTELEPVLRSLRTAVAIEPDQPYSLAAGREARQPQLLEHVDDSLYSSYGIGEAEEAMLRKLAPRSYFGVPLVTRDDDVIGSIMLAYSSSGRQYTADDAGYFIRVADTVSLLLENARLYEEQASTARDLQLVLLPPKLPADPRIELHALYEPSSEMAMVGGDWYDAFFLTEDRLGLVLGDIVGKGVRAAATMGQLKVAVRAYALEGHGVDATLERLERFVHRLPAAMYASLCYAVVDLAASSISYGCAGHPPPILIPADGRAHLMEGGRQSLLGCNRRSPTVGHSPLRSGDAVLFYSDGLVERRDSPITDDIETLMALIEVHPRLVQDLPALAAKLGASAHRDDTTALSVTFT